MNFLLSILETTASVRVIYSLILDNYTYRLKGSCGSVVKVVAYDFKVPWFESCHRQKIILNIYSQLH